MKGRVLSEEHKLNISKSLLNKEKSLETKLKISKSLINHPSLKNSEKKYKAIEMLDIYSNSSRGSNVQLVEGIGLESTDGLAEETSAD